MNFRLKATISLLWLLLVSIMTARPAQAHTLLLAAANTRPTAYFQVDGKPTGMLIDLVTEAFRRAGYKVEFKLMPWARCLTEAKTGAVDGVFSSFRLPEREQFLGFTNEALTTQAITLFARRNSTISFDGDLSTLRDVKIGIIIGTSYGKKFDAAVKNGTLPSIDPTNNIDSNLAKLALGRVDLVPSLREVAMDTAERLNLLSKIKEVSPPLEFMPSYLAFTKVRDLSKPSHDFDREMALMKRDGSYDRIVKRYARLASNAATEP